MLAAKCVDAPFSGSYLDSRFQRLSRSVMPHFCVSVHLPLVRRGAGALEEATGSAHRLRSLDGVRWRAFLLYIWMAVLNASLGLERRLRARDEVR